MTTIVQYVQQPYVAFEFDATLDGQLFNCTLTWNFFGRRLYINVVSPNGILVVCEALVGSPPVRNIQSLTWANGWATLMTTAPHGFHVLDTVALVVRGSAPAAYNGQFDMLVIDNFTLAYQITSDPGAVSQIGQVSFDVNLVQSYFQTSSLVYRAGLQQFEINP